MLDEYLGNLADKIRTRMPETPDVVLATITIPAGSSAGMPWVSVPVDDPTAQHIITWDSEVPNYVSTIDICSSYAEPMYIPSFTLPRDQPIIIDPVKAMGTTGENNYIVFAYQTDMVCNADCTITISKRANSPNLINAQDFDDKIDEVYANGFTLGVEEGIASAPSPFLQITDWSNAFSTSKVLYDVVSYGDTRNGTIFDSFCEGFYHGPSIKALDTSSGESFIYAFNYSTAVTIEGINLTNAKNVNSMFTGCGNLTDLTLEGTISVDGLSFADCSSLSKQSITNVINALAPISEVSLYNNVTITDTSYYRVNVVNDISAIEITGLDTGLDYMLDFHYADGSSGYNGADVTTTSKLLINVSDYSGGYVDIYVASTQTGLQIRTLEGPYNRTVTLNSTSVLNAFGDNYSTNQEWLDLIGSKDNWTIAIA